MRIPLYQVHAFAARVFAGNPAGVCPLPRWLDDATMQSIAAENALAETAFFVREDGGYDIRWFTPVQEIDLCGHATLASGFVVFHHLDPAARAATFRSKSGPLTVTRDGERLTLDFPARPPAACERPAALDRALGHAPREVLRARDYLAVYGSEDEVRSLDPRMDEIAALDALGVIATAPGKASDFVSRFFAPRAGVPEDPVTGSAHCTLVPYWSARLGRKKLHAFQVSRRGGELWCEDRGARVLIAGRAVPYLEGTIEV
ncbi:MAG TPA: PhzF family phenazine biosynthesis protein [Candidatus Eisenbacteria bacterium]|jgi:PhzF family phenazine biosynthesis protein